MQSPHWSKGTETADTTCALSGSISGAGKLSEIRLHMCGPPLYLVFLNHCLKGCRGTCIVLIHFRKLHLCTLVFLYVFFRRKNKKLTALFFHSKWLDWNSATISLIWSRSVSSLKKLHLCTLQNLEMYRISFFTFADLSVTLEAAPRHVH